MMGFSSSKGNKPPALFEVRVKSAEHDVILVKGAPHEASSVLLSGTVVLSVSEPMHIKKLTLRMYGMLRLNLMTTYRGPKGPTERSFKYDKRFFEHVWDNINIQDYFHNLYDNYGSQRSILSKTNSFSSLHNLHAKAKSTTSLKSLGSTSSTNSHLLVKGNYEFPFSALLPGTLTESVEGLPNASVIYKIQATIERGKFATDLICKKHMRVVRTLTPDAVDLSETMSVDNTWPNKVDYSISVPAKAIAIGSSTTVHILMVPLLKGLKLGPIKISLVEYSSYCAPYGAGNTQERVVSRLKISDPLNQSNGEGREEEDSDFQDKWEVNAAFSVPPSLSKCTQDCSILSNIKVRHKLKFVISLFNPDGHVSELRASLPVQLFISPFVALGVRGVDSLDSSADISANSTDVEGDDDDMIFGNTASELDLAAANGEQGPASSTSATAALMAPPTYESHIYDRLWSGISFENTPTTSGRQSPVGSNEGSFLNSQQEVNALQEGLRRLHVQQQTPSGVESGYSTDANTGEQPESAGISSLSETGSKQTPPVDYFAMPVRRQVQNMFAMNPGLRSPGPMSSPAPMSSPGLDHISRNNSFGPFAPPATKSDWKLNSLSRVPSYENAMKGDSLPIDLPPAYPNEGGEEVTCDLERPKMAHQKSSGMLSTNGGIQLSHAALTRSNNSSSSSLPKFQLSRNSTGGSNVSINGSLSKNNTASKHFGFSMTPLGHKKEQWSPSNKSQNSPERTLQNDPDSNPSPPSMSRNGSLMNLKGLLRKKGNN